MFVQDGNGFIQGTAIAHHSVVSLLAQVDYGGPLPVWPKAPSVKHTGEAVTQSPKELWHFETALCLAEVGTGQSYRRGPNPPAHLPDKGGVGDPHSHQPGVGVEGRVEVWGPVEAQGDRARQQIGEEACLYRTGVCPRRQVAWIRQADGDGLLGVATLQGIQLVDSCGHLHQARHPVDCVGGNRHDVASCQVGGSLTSCPAQVGVVNLAKEQCNNISYFFLGPIKC